MKNKVLEDRSEIPGKNKKMIFNKVIDRISYSGRRKRNLKETNESMSKYMKMSDAEFIMDYTEVCSRYEHKKLIFIVLSTAVTISVIMNIWKSFYGFLINVITSKSIIAADIKNLAIILFLIIMLVIMAVVILIFYDTVKTIYALNRKRIFLNQIRDMRKIAISDKGKGA